MAACQQGGWVAEVDVPRGMGWGAAQREIRVSAAQDGARRRGRAGGRTAHRDCCERMRSRRGAAGGRRDESGSGHEWGKYLGVEEWTLAVGPNQYAGPGMGASGPTRPDRHRHQSIIIKIIFYSTIENMSYLLYEIIKTYDSSNLIEG